MHLKQARNLLSRGIVSKLLAGTLLALAPLPVHAGNPLTIENRSGPSGAKYSVIRLHNATVNFVISKPNSKDEKLLFVFPAGFVTAEGKAIGVYVYGGVVHNKVNRKLTGALKILDGNYEVIDTKSGASLTEEFCEEIAVKKGGLFQQFTIVRKGKAATFKDNGKAVRRGIGKLADGQNVVVESKGDITLAEYAADASALGVKDLIYTDLGKWGEAWLRDPVSGEILTTGDERKKKGVIQSNWITVSRPAAISPE